MSHLNGILDKQKEVQTTLTDTFSDTNAVGEVTENWTNTHPNYSALMIKSDEILDLMNEFKTDLLGKVDDLKSLAQ